MPGEEEEEEGDEEEGDEEEGDAGCWRMKVERRRRSPLAAAASPPPHNPQVPSQELVLGRFWGGFAAFPLSGGSVGSTKPGSHPQQCPEHPSPPGSASFCPFHPLPCPLCPFPVVFRLGGFFFGIRFLFLGRCFAFRGFISPLPEVKISAGALPWLRWGSEQGREGWGKEV